MRSARYALVSLVSALLGVMLALAAQHVGASLSLRGGDAPGRANEIAEQESAAPRLSDAERERLMRENTIDEISLTHTIGYVESGSYEVTLRRNGEAVFVGQQGAPRKGRHTGYIGTWDFYRLSRLIAESKQFDRPAEFKKGVMDADTYVITVVQNGRSVRVSDYADSAPFGVWQVERTIDGVVAGAMWQPAR